MVDYTRRRHWAARLTAVMALLASGCTAITYSDGENCETTADCTALGEAFASAVCTEDNICVDASEVGCATSSECIEDLGTETARCVDNTCVNLLTSDCRSVEPVEAVADDDAILIGWMGALEGDFVSIGLPIQRATQLAVEEFNDQASGLPGGTDGGRRPLVLISCHDLADESGIRAANHLVDDVGVPAIVGPLFSSITLNVIADVTIPKNVLTISPSATSPVFTDFNDDDLHWRTVPSDTLQAVPLAYLVGQLEQRLRDDMVLLPGDDFRVVTVSNDGTYGRGLFDAFNSQVAFNDGKSASQNLTDGNYSLLSYDDPAENENVDLSSVVSEILAIDPPPHLVVALGTNEVIDREGDDEGILSLLESQWDSVPGPRPRPYYLFPDGGKVDELLALAGDDTSTPPLSVRVRGTAGSGALGNPRFESFALRFQSRYGTAPGIYSENAYDAMYLLAYGILAAGEGVLDGSFIASGLKRMSEGTKVDTGPNNINGTVNALSGGGSIDYEGASGPLDFDNDTGEAPSNIEVWCLGENNQNKPVFDSSAQYYEAATDTVIGADTCDTL